VYDVYRVLPFPIEDNDTESKYTCIQPEREYILIDSTKRYYVKFRYEDVSKCRQMRRRQIICKQDFPLLITHLANDYEVLMLQSIRLAPKTCAQRILELKETLWISLKDNSWIYVAPAMTQMTILCSDQKPTDIEIEGSGILTFLGDCTGYGDKTMIRLVTSHYVNHVRKDNHPTSVPTFQLL
jgi:hypothetical protein